jgi:hypothetical protein
MPDFEGAWVQKWVQSSDANPSLFTTEIGTKTDRNGSGYDTC